MEQLRGAALLWKMHGIKALLSALRTVAYSSERVLRLVRTSGEQVTKEDKASPLSVRRLSVLELAGLRDSVDGLPLAFHLDRIREASRPYVALWDGELAHVSWVFMLGAYSPDMALAPGEAEIRYSHTLPRFRGRGIYRAVIREIARDLEAEGIRRLYAHVVESNTSSLRAFLANGFTVSLRLRTMRVAGVPVVFSENGGRGLRWPRRSR